MPSMTLALVLALILASAEPVGDKRGYELRGRVLQSNGSPFIGILPVVFLHGALSPYSNQTLAGHDGSFRFKDIPEGTYTLFAAVERVGETQKTVEVGKSFADSKNRVSVELRFSTNAPQDRRNQVSRSELSVPAEAAQEYRRAREVLSRQEVEKAIDHLKKALEIAPGFSAALNHLGTISYQRGQYLQAEKYFRDALKADPESYSPLVNLGGVLIALNRFEESLQFNEAAVKAMPGDPLAHSQLGKSCFYTGKIEAAEIHLKRAKSLDPAHFSYPQLFLVEIYARRNDLKSAVIEMEEFLKLHPDSDWAPGVKKALETARARLSSLP
jgi:tetratricopeptide (TPR) repeat protein